MNALKYFKSQNELNREYRGMDTATIKGYKLLNEKQYSDDVVFDYKDQYGYNMVNYRK